MDYLKIVKIGLYAFIIFELCNLFGAIILVIADFIKLNKNEIKYKKPIATKIAERLVNLYYIIFFIGVAVAILNYGFY